MIYTGDHGINDLAGESTRDTSGLSRHEIKTAERLESSVSTDDKTLIFV
jgi:hypothetical protein